MSDNILGLIREEKYQEIIQLLEYDFEEKNIITVFDSIQNRMRKYGAPTDTLTKIDIVGLLVPQIADVQNHLLKRLTILYYIPDELSPDFYNKISFSFESKKEKELADKTHNYKLIDISFKSSKTQKEISDKVAPQIDKIMNDYNEYFEKK